MIIGNPTLQSALDFIETEGCPYCGKLPGTIFVDGPSEIILEDCGHVVDATPWIDGELDASDLEANLDG